MTACVLLHGFLGAPASWQRVCSSPFFPAAERVAYCPVLPGHGLPPAPVPESFEAALVTLASEIRNRFLPPVYLAGYSLGARLALGLLVRFPDLFAGALLIGVAPGLSGPERERRVAADAELAANLRKEGLPAFLESWRRLPLFANQADLPAELRTEQEAINLAHDPAALAASLEVLSPGRMPDFRPVWPEIGVPVELMVGARDDKFLALAREMQENKPDCRLEVVPGVFHNVILEAPDAVATALLRLAARKTR